MKYIFKFSLTFITLLFVTFIASKWLGRSFVDLAFPTSFISTIVIVSFSSKGGLCTEALDMRQYAFRSKLAYIKEHGANEYLKSTDFKLKVNSVVSASFVYTFLTIAHSVVSYWEYF